MHNALHSASVADRGHGASALSAHDEAEGRSTSMIDLAAIRVDDPACSQFWKMAVVRERCRLPEFDIYRCCAHLLFRLDSEWRGQQGGGLR